MASTRRVESADGTHLAVVEHGPSDAPTVVCIHGYPDNKSVWDGVVERLAERYHVVTYDVRGFGESDKPADRHAYHLDRLAEDLAAVFDAVAPRRKVHLLAHDWGSILAWHAVTDDAHASRVASFTSVSGPSLDQAGRWMRTRPFAGPGGIRKGLTQVADSWYAVAFFQLPVLPELAVKSGLLDRGLTRLARIGQGSGDREQTPTGTTDDKLHGINLYRANMLSRTLLRPERRRADVPVQVIAPQQDVFVSAALQSEAPVPFASDLRVRRVAGGHWVVASRPDVIARLAAEFIDHVEGGPETRALANARVQHGTKRRPFHGQLVVVTGAGHGVGRAAALEFARQGADVVTADIDDAAARETADAVRGLGSEAWSYRLDMADAQAFENFAKQVRTDVDVPDVVVNNAGIGMTGSFLGTTVDEWNEVIDVNLWSVIHGCRLFGAQMIERGQGGNIVNAVAGAEHPSSTVTAALATTRAAVLMLTECMRADLGRDGVGVTAVSHTDGAERVARHIVKATAANKPVARVSPQAKVLRTLSGYSPAMLRQMTGDALTPS